MKLSEAQRAVLQAVPEGEWVPGYRVPHLVALNMPRYRVLPQQTVTLDALVRRGLLYVRARNAGLVHEYRRQPAGTAALAAAGEVGR